MPRSVVKAKFDGEDHFAVFSTVVMGTVTDYMPRAAMARFLKEEQPSLTPEQIAATLENAEYEL